VTLSGILALVMPEELKAALPIDVTLSGILRLVEGQK
jgi:hypothetical protein